MPAGERREVPLGQAHGAAIEQQQFIQAAKPAAAAGPAAPGAAATRPSTRAPSTGPELVTGDPELDEVLLGPTERPDEPVTGVPPTPQRVSDFFDMLAGAAGGSPDVVALAEQARELGL